MKFQVHVKLGLVKKQQNANCICFMGGAPCFAQVGQVGQVSQVSQVGQVGQFGQDGQVSLVSLNHSSAVFQTVAQPTYMKPILPHPALSWKLSQAENL